MPKTKNAAKKQRRRPVKLLLFSLVSLVLFSLYILKDLPSPYSLTTRRLPLTTKILDRHGAELFNIYADQNRTLLDFDKFPKHLINATVAVEDKDFFHHAGINPVGGIARAVKDTILRHQVQGGSTITQQLIKYSLLTPERSLVRKIKEVVLAFWAERLYRKNQILTMYLNRVPYGGTAYGIESAAQTYFGKPAPHLTLAEAALLAGLPAAPTYYSPFGAHPELAKERQREVLNRMVEDGYLKSEEARAAYQEELKFLPPKTPIRAPHFTLYIKELLVQKYGLEKVETGGLKVTTSLDWSIQKMAEDEIARGTAKQKKLKVGNGAALVTNPKTGEILSMVGSNDYFATDSGKVNVVLAERSPGSSIKPLNYALGFDRGRANPATLLIDAPTCFPGGLGQKAYCPGNYDGRFHGPVQARFALGNSYNIPAVKMLALNGLQEFIATSSALGLTTFKNPSRYGLSLTLGGGEVKMIDMAVAFGTLANGGLKAPLAPILKVEDSEGALLENRQTPNPEEKNRVFSSEAVYLVSHILLDDNARAGAFGAGGILNIPGHPAVAVKTGTTEDKRDNWTIGYSFGDEKIQPYLSLVWVGNNDNSPMSPYLESGNTGAAPIWHNIMSALLKDQPSIWPAKPSNITGREICVPSGKLPKPEDPNCNKRFEYFIKGMEPKEFDEVSKAPIFIDKATGKPGREGQTENVEEQEHPVVSDQWTKNYCVDCAY